MPEAGGRGERHLGEDDLVAVIRKVLSGGGPGVLVGPGDDAAVVEAPRGTTVLTADMLVEGVHFDRTLTSPRDLGHKAIVVNVSDVAAMAASPRYALVSLGLGPADDPPWVVELYGGMRAACDEYALSLVGGDVNRSPVSVISVTAVGEAPPGRAVLRSGARPGDRVVVTGSLGASAGGLLLARSGNPAMTTDWGRALLEAHFRPAARVGEGQTLAQCGATAMMDVSDGLLLDLSRLCAESAVGARLALPAVPVAAELHELAKAIPCDPLRLALSGGEDYELVATLPAPAVDEARQRLDDRFGVALAEVGEITERGFEGVDAAGEVRPLRPEGWDHLAG